MTRNRSVAGSRVALIAVGLILGGPQLAAAQETSAEPLPETASDEADTDVGRRDARPVDPGETGGPEAVEAESGPGDEHGRGGDAPAAPGPAEDAPPQAAADLETGTEQEAAPADAEPGATIIAPADLPTAEQLEQALAEQYRLHMEAQHYQDAIEVAQSALELAGLDREPTDAALVDPLIRLAQAQSAAGEYEGAATSFLRAIEILEQSEGPFSERLIDPLTDLGETYTKAGQYEPAISAYESAIHVTRRNHGLFNLEQADILDDLADSYSKLGEYEDADREQRYALRAAEKTFGEDDPRVVPALKRLARWYRRTEQYPIERTYLKHAIDIVEQANGTNALALVELLRSLAESYRVERVRHSEAEQALMRALDIVESQEQADFTEHVATLVELGDYHTVHRAFHRADEFYRRAWELLETQGDERALQETFGAPHRLVYSAPFAVDLIVERSSMEEPPHVEFRFTVTEDGRIIDMEVVESTLPNALTRDVIASLKVARYRPRYVDGVPVRTEGVRLKQSYPVRNPSPRPSKARDDEIQVTSGQHY